MKAEQKRSGATGARRKRKRAAPPDPQERLRRLLLIVPAALRRPGITVTELAEQLGMEPAQLRRELEFLPLVGIPPFNPDDLIDLWVEDDRVHVMLDQAFKRPPRLTPFEALALGAAARAVAPADPALRRALQKIDAAVAPAARALYAGLSARVEAGSDSAPAELIERLREAVRRRREVVIDYYAESRGEAMERPVRPYTLLLHHGYWYLYAWDLTRKDDRLFRIDRIRSLRETERTFPPPARIDIERLRRDKLVPDSKEPDIRIRFGAASAPRVVERLGAGAFEKLAGGGVVARLSSAGGGGRWALAYALSFGGDAEVLEPKELREAFLKAAREAYAAHR